MRDFQGNESNFGPESTTGEVTAQFHRQMVDQAASHAGLSHAIDIYTIVFWLVASILSVLLFIFMIWIIIGYFKNIFKLFVEISSAPTITPMMAARVLGIFIPLIGGILGHMNDDPDGRNESYVKTILDRKDAKRIMKNSRIVPGDKIEPFF